MTPEKCPWCRAQPHIDNYAPLVRPVESFVRCDCGAMGPTKATEAEAIREWDIVARGEHITERV